MLPVLEPISSSSRTRLLRRIEETPPFWIDIAARLGVIGADASLCALGREVANVIRAVGESAESDRQRLESLRSALHIAIDTRIGELLAKVATAESAKLDALERELERLDAALERTRREHAAAREVLTSKSDDEITALSAALSASLDDIDALLATLPHGPVEPSLLQLQLDEDALLSYIRTAGIVLAPRGVQAIDVVVRGLPTTVRPGRPFQFELAMSHDYPCRTPAELEAAAASLAFHARVDASLESAAETRQLVSTLVPASDGTGIVVVSVAIPEFAIRGAFAVIQNITVAGHPLTGGQSLPVQIHLTHGMHAPLVIRDAVNTFSSTPVITAEGTIYIPRRNSRDVIVVGADGTPRPSLHQENFGLSHNTTSAAFVDATSTLLLADSIVNHSKLIAINTSNLSVQWSAKLKSDCDNIAVLPAHGVVVVSEYDRKKLRVHRLADGVRVASVWASGTSHVAADPSSGIVYASTATTGYLFTVSAFRWDGSALVAEGPEGGVLEASGDEVDWRPLAVMPPAPGRSTSYLVVGTRGLPRLRVLSLPDRRLAHTHTLEGMKVSGLAADPSGTALAVCDGASKAVHILPWPLPGMPPLL
jgi:hypothetical protein